MAKCRRKFDSTGKAGTKSTLAHVVKSMYAYQLRNWYEYFDPSQFHIFSIEQYSKTCWSSSLFLTFWVCLYDLMGKLSRKSHQFKRNIVSNQKRHSISSKVLSEATSINR